MDHDTAYRLAIIGTSGSGKTTLAMRLAVALGAPHIELDQLYWRAGWEPVDAGAFEDAVRRAVAAPNWVCDGNFSLVRAIVFGRATDVVWMNLPFPKVFWRLLRRTVRRVATSEPLYGGNRESLRKSFFSRESILLWAIQTHPGYRREYANLPGREFPHLRVHELRSDDAVEAFARALEGRPGSSGSLRSGPLA